MNKSKPHIQHNTPSVWFSWYLVASYDHEHEYLCNKSNYNKHGSIFGLF